jgi:hypothetical protein
MSLLVAQAGIASTVGWYAIVAVAVVAIVAILVVFARQGGINVPPFVITVLWIIAAAVCAILAIKIILSLV